MTQTVLKQSKKAGLPPGTLIHVGKRKSQEVKISVIDYNKSSFSESICKSPEDCFPYKDTNTVSWINIDGLHNTEAINAIGQHFGLHPLLIEDILNTKHRPKMEEFSDHMFLALKMLGIKKDGTSFLSEQVSFVLGKTWVISFQEQEGDIFNDLRKNISENKGVIRHQGADYLFYRFIDTVVDHYFFVTDHLSESTLKLEEKVLLVPDRQALHEIQRLKRLLINFRKSITPLREAVGSLQKFDTALIKKGTIRYLQDVYEHLIHVSESIDTQRDILASIMELYLSGISNKMNQIMQVLTIMATIFIPLTFIAGVYGMNFDNMPELRWKYGYIGIWIIMIIVTVIMLRYFKRKKWL